MDARFLITRNEEIFSELGYGRVTAEQIVVARKVSNKRASVPIKPFIGSSERLTAAI